MILGADRVGKQAALFASKCGFDLSAPGDSDEPMQRLLVINLFVSLLWPILNGEYTLRALSIGLLFGFLLISIVQRKYGLYMLLAAKFGKPVCPHAGGVGLCEYVQHLALIDFICVSGSLDNRVLEYVDHLHEHFLDPVVLRDGCYVPPRSAGYSIEMKAASLSKYEFKSAGMLR